MPNLIITRAKPNPAGKDRVYGRPVPAQLLGEWVDITNNTGSTLSLDGAGLAHRTFDAQGRVQPTSTIYWEGGRGQVLSAGQILRVHTGRESERHLMNYEDSVGTHFHVFAESSNFVLNNAQGDEPSIWVRGQDRNWSVRLDGAWYAAYPGEGVALRRVGNNLVP